MADEEIPYEEEPEVELDPALVEHFMRGIKDEQNLPLAVLAGGVVALVTGGLWAWITVATGYTTGIGAILVGIAVGIAVRTTGKGLDPIFGVVGGGWAFLAVAAGNLLSLAGFVAKQEGVPVGEALSFLVGEYGVVQAMTDTFSLFDLLFYAIAIYEGYKFAFRKITPEELATLARG